MEHISSQEDLKHLKIEQSGDYVLVPKSLWDEINRKLDNMGEQQGLSFEVNDIGDLIKFTRTTNNLTKKEFASKANIEECQVSNFENKKKKPRAVTIDKIDKAFNGFKNKASSFQN